MANFVHVTNGQVDSVQDILPNIWDGVTLTSLNDEERRAVGWYKTSVEEPLGYDSSIYKIAGPFFTIRDTDVLEKYTLEERSDEEKQAIQQAIADNELAIRVTIADTQDPEVAALVEQLKTKLNR